MSRPTIARPISNPASMICLHAARPLRHGGRQRDNYTKGSYFMSSSLLPFDRKSRIINGMATSARPSVCARFHRASELIGRRWTGAIIFVLLKSRCRFAALREAIPDITDRMLSERLQELEQEAIVERIVVPETPGRVEN